MIDFLSCYYANFKACNSTNVSEHLQTNDMILVEPSPAAQIPPDLRCQSFTTANIWRFRDLYAAWSESP